MAIEIVDFPIKNGDFPPEGTGAAKSLVNMPTVPQSFKGPWSMGFPMGAIHQGEFYHWKHARWKHLYHSPTSLLRYSIIVPLYSFWILLVVDIWK